MGAARRRKRRHVARAGWSLLAIAVAAVVFLPFYWAISLSVRDPRETFTVTGLGVPFVQYKPTLANWRTELATGETQKALANSLVVAVATAVVVLVVGTPAAYAIARFKFRRPSNQDITLWFLSQRVLPPVATAIPLFLMIRWLGLLDTRTGLVLLNVTFCLPLVVVVMRQAFLDLPVELEEAAMVDGASHGTIFLRICLPLAAPSLVAAVLIVIAFTWNEFLFALMIGSLNAKVIPVHMAGGADTRGVQFWFVAVRTLIAMTPPVVLALLAQRYIVRGLTFGALKG
ncbi:MAG TPA: carbohydrate ABC transporter permease [Planctomycetota bacterium]|nr:carbohydrate ABC transporter permease [Planctomycetota bacterium]